MIGNIIFPLIVCVLNWIAVKKYLSYDQEIIKTFLIPLASSAVMGVITVIVKCILDKIFASNIITVCVSLVIAIIVYFTSMILFKGITEGELSSLPKGRVLIKIFKKIKLL